MVSVTLAVQINKTFIGAKSKRRGNVGGGPTPNTGAPLIDLRGRPGNGPGSSSFVQDPEAPARQRMGHPGIHDLSYPPSKNKHPGKERFKRR